ncbi:hypothetical protein RGUI_0182 [Rhodovulum sp. P5]|nr:hypothetical protein RGUI_0182 [Rhodovulum sp. P5]
MVIFTAEVETFMASAVICMSCPAFMVAHCSWCHLYTKANCGGSVKAFCESCI